jgi:hypothetical protein
LSAALNLLQNPGLSHPSLRLHLSVLSTSKLLYLPYITISGPEGFRVLQYDQFLLDLIPVQYIREA